MSLVTGIFSLHWNIHTNRATLINCSTGFYYCNIVFHGTCSSQQQIKAFVPFCYGSSVFHWSKSGPLWWVQEWETLDLQSIERQAALFKCTVPSSLFLFSISSLCRLLGSVLEVYMGLFLIHFSFTFKSMLEPIWMAMKVIGKCSTTDTGNTLNVSRRH